MNQLDSPLSLDIAERIGMPMAEWKHKCHEVSLAIVRAKIFSPSRVARGVCRNVFSQHSWVVLGKDCYDPDAQILDATLWSYDPQVKGVWFGNDGRHVPHGAGSIWNYGKPPEPEGPIIELAVPISKKAQGFLDLIGPMDRRGWHVLLNSPVGEWPASEIIAAADDTPALSPMIPIDILGMITDRNPGGLYL